jgi:hypothetical protein
MQVVTCWEDNILHLFSVMVIISCVYIPVAPYAQIFGTYIGSLFRNQLIPIEFT